MSATNATDVKGVAYRLASRAIVGLWTIAGQVAGALVAFDSVAGVWIALPPGAAGDVLTSNGAGLFPSYQPTAGGTLDVRFLPGSGAQNVTDQYVQVTATGIYTLDAAPVLGTEITVYRDYVGADYTIDGNGKTIDGAASAILNSDKQSIRLVYNGAAWTIN